MKTIKSKVLVLGLIGLGALGTMTLIGMSLASNENVTVTPVAQSGDAIATATPEAAVTGSEVNDAQEINSNDETAGETKDDNVTLPVNAISETQASQVALQANPGAKVTGISTDDEDGTIVYTIVLDNKTEVKVDVVKGTILKTEKGGEGHYNKSHTEGTGEIEDGDKDVGGGDK